MTSSFSRSDIDALKESVKARLSEKRFNHTLAVADAAVRLGELCAPKCKDKLEVAALLHDVTKELTTDEQLRIIKSADIRVDDEDLSSPAILHAFTAPEVIKSDFSAFADAAVLSAVYNHTIGSPEMSVFDEIIFLADFIEDTRTYDASVEVRNFVWENMANADSDARIKILHKAVILAIDSTLKLLKENKKTINSKNILTRNALLSKI